MSRTRCTLGCNSSDGLARYPDGWYCHACHRFRPDKSDEVEIFGRSIHAQVIRSETYMEFGLPSQEYQEYLQQWEDYEWVLEEPKFIRIYDDGHKLYRNLCGFRISYVNCQEDWIARCLGYGPKWLKIFSPENKNIQRYPCHSRSEDSVIFITEDMVSALCISDFYDAYPLLGTSIRKEELNFLAERYRNVVLWLDSDHAGCAARTKIEPKLQQVFRRVTVAEPHWFVKEPKQFNRKGLENNLKDLV